MMRLHKILLTLVCLTALSAHAQWKWLNPLECGFPVIQNQGWTEEIGDSYVRLPQRAEGKVRKPVWDLSRNSAGLAIHFFSNAPELKVRYQVSGPLNMPHMPTTGVSGVDLYSIDSDGQWRFYFGGYPSGDTLQYHYTNIGKDLYHDRGYEFRLYLPPYNTIKWLEIGVPENDELTFIPVSPEKPILLYGTSIAQGACASRPGMTWGTILQRSLGYPLINLGFSGNGRLEKEVLDFICEIDARLYILDCLPNLTPKSKDEITQLVSDAVKQIRATHSSPILLVEHAGYSNALADDTKLQDYVRMNEGAKKAFEELQAQGIKDIYYLTREELGLHPDAWVDYVHPSDWGMETQANAVERKVREILRIPEGNLSTTQPVTQRREPNNYEWQKRHRDILSLNQSNPPRRVILGNSITHFWGGEPKGPSVRGMETWEKIMRPAGFHNLGYGFDRIENVLWRVYHGELDGYKAEEVVLMIGTNNIGINNDNEIVEGIRFLLSAIKQRQPEAKIKVIGILPRRNQEERVRNLNLRIRQMAETGWYTFKNPGTKLLQEDGKINESLFSDGLHPNEEGYKQNRGRDRPLSDSPFTHESIRATYATPPLPTSECSPYEDSPRNDSTRRESSPYKRRQSIPFPPVSRESRLPARRSRR